MVRCWANTITRIRTRNSSGRFICRPFWNTLTLALDCMDLCKSIVCCSVYVSLCGSSHDICNHIVCLSVPALMSGWLVLSLLSVSVSPLLLSCFAPFLLLTRVVCLSAYCLLVFLAVSVGWWKPHSLPQFTRKCFARGIRRSWTLTDEMMWTIAATLVLL